MKQTKKDVVGLEGLLIQPIQRIPRYILLLDTLNGKTPDNHPDKENAQEASKSLQRVMNYLDQDITSHEFRQKFLDFGAKIKGASVMPPFPPSFSSFLPSLFPLLLPSPPSLFSPLSSLFPLHFYSPTLPFSLFLHSLSSLFQFPFIT